MLLFIPAFSFGQDFYWESPEIVVPTGVKFIQSASIERLSVLAWQEFVPRGPEGGDVYISLIESSDGITWNKSERCAGPYPYQGKQLPIFSVAIDPGGRIFLAVVSGERTLSVLDSTDRGRTFKRRATLTSREIIVVPRISLSSQNGFILFVSYQYVNELGIYFTHSETGDGWTALTPLVAGNEGLSQHALPFNTVHNNGDYVVFQAKLQGTDFQLFTKYSGDGGKNWTRAAQITDFSENMEGLEITAARIVNQRPFIVSFGAGMVVVWERNQIGKNPQVYVMPLDRNGRRSGNATIISKENATCYSPQIIKFRDKLYYLWFDDAGGIDRLLFAWQDGAEWKLEILKRAEGSSQFPRPVVLAGNLYIFFENKIPAAERLVLLKPDQYVQPPVLSALNFSPAGFGRLSVLRVRWNVPEDSTGISSFYYLADRNPNVSYAEGREKSVSPSDTSAEASFEIQGEGIWYVSVFARDYAGNISRAAQVTYTRDTTPPGRVQFLTPVKDREGFFPDNTFTLTWKPPANDTIAGYAYKAQQFSEQKTASVFLNDYPVPPQAPAFEEPKALFDNLFNGTWAVSVRAIDMAGNAGEPETIVFNLKNYRPVTYITTVSDKRNALEQLELEIFGLGFAEGGMVDRVMIDRDGKEPYDFSFTLANAEYRVESDRIISGILIPEIDEGTYQVGLHHPMRGLYFSQKNVLKVESSGVVKYGPFSDIYRPSIGEISRFFFSLSFGDIMIWLIVVFLIVAFIITARKVIALGSDAQELRLEVTALIEGGELPMPEKKKKIEKLRKKGISLRIKFTLLISMLVLIIVLIVALPISVFMIQTQQRTLAEKLYDEVNLVLGGVVEGTKTYLFEKNTLVLSENLEKQYSLIPEVAQFAIVTGPQFVNPRTGELDLSDSGVLDLSSMEHIWAAIDITIASKTKTGEFIPIVSEIKDDISPLIPELSNRINAQAEEKLNFLNREIDRITDEYNQLLFRTDPQAIAAKDRLLREEREYIKQRTIELEQIGNFMGSVPAFDPDRLDLSIKSYKFYKPVVLRVRGYDNYFWGMGRFGVSTDKIIREIQGSRQLLMIQTSIIALIALALGVAGALVMATITINPIRRLSSGVAVIRDTTDKSLLKDHAIIVRTHDEIRELADTVNQMTQGLVKAANANKELVVGKEVQKMFIPLDVDTSGKKRTTGLVSNDFVDIFGYYEGAKGVSGDYFDFKRLDNKHFAIIKCDVAGKGVPAALIMVEVATIFLTYFRDWNYKKDGIKIDTLVYRINDMLEERGFKGRFAALTLCLLNSETGVCTFCNAGDNLLHIFRNRTKKLESITLNNAPAAGVFPSMLIETQSGFKQMAQKLEKDDLLFLFTDGIDEAKRVFRGADFNPVVCDEPGLKEGELHGGTHAKGSDNEEFGLKRFEEIVEAVFSRGTFKLSKHHNPVPNEELVFDFSGATGDAADVVTAIVAVEKIFRVYPDPQAGRDDLVRVDKKIDAFLSTHFLQYREYFQNHIENPEEPDYVYFAHLKEDEQYDDLTILVVRKK